MQLSKINLLGFVKGKTGSNVQNAGNAALDFRMSFEFLDDYPKEIYADMGDRLIGKSGNSNLYSIKAHPAWASVSKSAAALKGHLVNLALEGNQHHTEIGSIMAINYAREILSSTFGLDRDGVAAEAIAFDVFGYGPISFLLWDSANIEEIAINGGSSRISVYHSRYGFCETNMRFVSDNLAVHAINKLLESAEKELSQETPIIDASVEPGMRIHVQQRPYSSAGLIASIRLSKPERTGLGFLLKKSTLDPEMLAYLWMAIDAKLNIIITGPPSSGKTTLLKAIMETAQQYERVVTIEEEAAELVSHSNFSNAVYLIGKNQKSGQGYGISDQVVNALRLRPDRLIVGELRGSEARDAFFGSNTGVPFIATMHSSGAGSALIARLESKPMSVEHVLVSNLDIAVYISFDQSLNRKIMSISEYKWLSRSEIGVSDGKEFTVSELFENGSITREQLKGSKLITYFAMRNLISVSEAVKSFDKRVKFVKSFVDSQEAEFANYKTKYWD